MTQAYTPLDGAATIKDSRATINSNFDAVASNFSGTAFPTVNLTLGMSCWRSDQGRLYVLKDLTPTWQLVFDGRGFVESWNKRADLGASVDLNSIIESGWYHQPANANAASGTNYPAASAGLLQVFKSDVMVYQFYTRYETAAPTTYLRTYYNGVWGAWGKCWHSGNDGAGSGMDADMLDGFQSSASKAANTIPVRDANGKIAADLAGKADTAGAADTATTATAVPWSGVSGKPTTLAGFGITDAARRATVSTAAPSGGADGDVWYQV